MSYLEQRRKHIEDGRPLPPKKIYKLNKVAPKTAAKIAAAKEAWMVGGNTETEKEKWFKARRNEMVGVCQCGCAEKSSKHDEVNFRSSACHVFPQRLFPTIQFHPLNWVERKFWATGTSSGCHSQMDNKSMDLWPNMADWADIREKFFVLSPLLTQKERATKFYRQLEGLVYKS